MANRSTWIARNISTKTFSLGDLPRVPTFDPGSTYDLLSFHSKEDIEQSQSLLSVINKGWLTVKKNLDSAVTTTVTNSNAEDGLSTPDKTELGAGDGAVTNPLTEDLDLGGNDILEVGTIQVDRIESDPTLSPNVLTIAATGIDIEGDIDLNDNSILNIGYLSVNTDATHHVVTGTSTPVTNEYYLSLGWDGNEAKIYTVRQGVGSVPLNIDMGSGRIKGYLGTTYENDAEAVSGGLTTGDVYSTSTGELRVVVVGV